MVARTRVELVSPPWEGGVLTVRLTRQKFFKAIFLRFSQPQTKCSWKVWEICLVSAGILKLIFYRMSINLSQCHEFSLIQSPLIILCLSQNYFPVGKFKTSKIFNLHTILPRGNQIFCLQNYWFYPLLKGVEVRFSPLLLLWQPPVFNQFLLCKTLPPPLFGV